MTQVMCLMNQLMTISLFKSVGAGLVAGFLFTSPVALQAQAVLSGQGQALDGDSLMLEGQKLRLFGIDAPEYEQTCKTASAVSWPCGKAAHEALAKLLRQRPVSCNLIQKDRYGRFLAQCWITGSEGQTDIAAAMVAQGLALAYRRYSLDYLPFEYQARLTSQGIWQGSFTNPETWRRMNR